MKTVLPVSVSVPEGAVSWVTPELLAETLETWQPYYREELTEEDAIQILVDVGEAFDLILEEECEEKISCFSPCFQS